MSTAEYIATFISIVVGLALADLAISFHRLMRARSRIEWSWFPLAAALQVLLTIMMFWWTNFDRLTGQSAFGFAEFLPQLLSLLLLFLLAASALPDEIPEGRFDLGRYYHETRSYFWSLFALFILTTVFIRVSRMISGGAPITEIVEQTLDNLLFVAAMVVLAFTGRRWVHALFLAVILILITSDWIRLTVGS